MADTIARGPWNRAICGLNPMICGAPQLVARSAASGWEAKASRCACSREACPSLRLSRHVTAAPGIWCGSNRLKTSTALG